MHGPFMEGRVPIDIKSDGEYQDDARNKDNLKNQGSRSEGETHTQISVLFFKKVNYVNTPDGNRTDPIARWARVATQEGERRMIHGKETGSLLLSFSMKVMDSLYLIFERFNQ
jgi:hypothetical protein